MKKKLYVEYNEPKTFLDVYSRRENAFDILRFILAVFVIYGHSYPLLLGSASTGDILARLTHFQLDIAALAVYSFFVISGFLIIQSLENSSSYTSYFIKRTLRIVPAFFISLSLIAIVIGPIVSELSFAEYFSNSDGLGPFTFIYKNLFFNIKGYSWIIHDVFANNPFQYGLNGSMWTLKHEVACYIVLVILAVFHIVKYKKCF